MGSRMQIGIIALVAVLLAAGGVAALTQQRSPGSSTTGGSAAQPIPQRLRAGSGTTDQQIATLQSRLTKEPPAPKLYATLGFAYLQKVRETNNAVLYGKAESVFRKALEMDPKFADAIEGLGALALARHQFSEALDWGQRAAALNPYRAANYGVIGDSLVELGRYDEAVATVQKMVDTRPDISSYSRVSYLRELRGDVDGAIEAMRRAVGAGGPAAENTEYVRVLLGNLYFNSGRLAEAEQEYTTALQRLPGYGPAQGGLGYVRAARGDDAAAIDLFKKAAEALPLPEYEIALADLYARNGLTEETQRQYGLVQAINTLYTANGGNSDVETALFYADHDIDIPGALTRARDGYRARPSIHGADVLAWSLYKAGQPQEAEGYAREALRLGTKDALKLFHAGMIARALGKNDEARDYLEQALTINPNFSLRFSGEARTTLLALGGSIPAAAARTQP